MKKTFCKCEECRVEFLGSHGQTHCPDHRGVVAPSVVGVPEIKNKPEVPRPALRGLCSRCGLRPKAVWSNSYCNECYAAWKKSVRESKRKVASGVQKN